MIFDKRKMVRLQKLATPHWVKRMKKNKQLLLCEASNYNMLHEVDHGRLEKANGAWDLLSVNVRNYHAGSLV